MKLDTIADEAQHLIVRCGVEGELELECHRRVAVEAQLRGGEAVVEEVIDRVLEVDKPEQVVGGAIEVGFECLGSVGIFEYEFLTAGCRTELEIQRARGVMGFMMRAVGRDVSFGEAHIRIGVRNGRVQTIRSDHVFRRQWGFYIEEEELGTRGIPCAR